MTKESFNEMFFVTETTGEKEAYKRTIIGRTIDVNAILNYINNLEQLTAPKTCDLCEWYRHGFCYKDSPYYCNRSPNTRDYYELKDK